MTIQLDARTQTKNQRRESVTISEVSRLTGIPIPTIRSWERRYSFPAPPRTKGGHRRYSLSEVELLRDLQREISNGRSARDAASVVHARADAGEGDADRIVSAAKSLDLQGVRSALNDAGQRLGIEGAIQHVVGPALNRLHAHHEGDVTRAHTNLLVEESQRWLRCLPARAAEAGSLPVVLASSTGETHSLLLEAFSALLAQQGRECLTLGPTPGRSVLEAARSLHGCAVVLAAGNPTSRQGTLEALALLRREPSVRLYYTGDAFAAPTRRRNLPGHYLGSDLGEGVESLLNATKSGSA